MHTMDTGSFQYRRWHQVLVVDDDRLLRLHVREVLASVGIEVVEAADGHEALEAVRRTRFDAVLLDVRMPGMDGLETCRELRRLCGDIRLPVFMLTGLDDHETIDEAFASGATDFATKPLNWTVLKNRIVGLIQQHALAEHLDLSERHRRMLLKTIPDSIALVDTEGRILDARLSANHPADWPLQPGEQLFAHLPAQATGVIRNGMDELLQGGEASEVAVMVGEPGAECHFEVRMVPAGNRDVLLMLRNVTDRIRAEAEVRRLVFHDGPTGLPNAGLLREQLAHCVRQARQTGRRVAALRVDLFGLEHVPILLGSKRYERLLAACARRLQGAVYLAGSSLGDEISYFLGRTGEHGFAVLLSGIDRSDMAEQFGRVLLREISGLCHFEHYEIDVRPAIGIALFPDNDAAGEQLMEKAEVALRDVAIQGDQPIGSYSANTRRRTLHEAAMVKDLKQAIDRGELHLVYQPKVDARSGELRGVEALVRWQRDQQAVSPVEFIPLAEKHGLILPLGDLVLYQACRQSRSWARNGCGNIPIAVNFSSHQFNQRDMVKGLSDSLGVYGIAPGDLEVELTESVAIQNGARLRSVLGELGELGVSTAIDDFGTGFSSLSSLRNFNFDTLKIDRSFVNDLGAGASNAAILDAIIAMGHALGMKLVAEGVETDDQLAYLRDRGCDVIQGYLTGRPMAAEAIEQMVFTRH